MEMRSVVRALALLSVVVVKGTIAGCGIFDAYQREHHFKNDGSTALILDAKQRVLTQRKVDPDLDFQGKVTTGIVVCAEPSPDVANALSSALSTSLAAALPSGSGGKNISADLSLSKAESIVQLGTRIATIQLLRDELADLCRSYANGAVTATTYTLRLSRLDKKMVTLLLSEAAGRPVSAQAVIFGQAAAGTKPAASAEEISTARQSVIDASDALVAKEKELKEAAEDQKKTKQAERDAAFKTLQDKQALLLTMERRILNTSTSADTQSVVVNSTPSSADPGETLIALQDNFLLQDDLTTFLDACISSLDLLQRPLKDKDRELLMSQRAIFQRSVAVAEEAKNAVYSAKAQLDRSDTAAARVNSEIALIEAENAHRASEAVAAQEKESLYDLMTRLQPVSRFGRYCEDQGLELIVQANVHRITARRELLEARRQLIEAQARDTALRACEVALKSAHSKDPAVMKSCADALAQRPPLVAAAGESAPPNLAIRNNSEAETGRQP